MDFEKLKALIEDIVDFFKSFIERVQMAFDAFDVIKGYEKDYTTEAVK